MKAYDECLKRLAKEWGIETPTREQLATLDRKPQKKGFSDDCEKTHDPNARVTKMKDGPTRLAHKAEHAVDVDLESGARLAGTLESAADDYTKMVMKG